MQKVLEGMKKNSLAYNLEVALSNDPSLWETVGIPIPGDEAIYGYHYCLGQDTYFKKLQYEVLDTPDDEFTTKADNFFRQVSVRGEILKAVFKKVSPPDDDVIENVETIFANTQKVFEDARMVVLKGIRTDEKSTTKAKNMTADSIGSIRELIRKVRESTLKTN